ncbi:MAG: hypothetical protein H6618_00920 [Deltaproteobacteria bacterium]|nr:hypothetical protein [Deltaproteobacteria bacterium]
MDKDWPDYGAGNKEDTQAYGAGDGPMVKAPLVKVFPLLRLLPLIKKLTTAPGWEKCFRSDAVFPLEFHAAASALRGTDKCFVPGIPAAEHSITAPWHFLDQNITKWAESVSVGFSGCNDLSE